MKQLEDYVEDGWKVQVTLSRSEEGITYSAWTYDHPDLTKGKQSKEGFRKYKPIIKWDSGLNSHFV